MKPTSVIFLIVSVILGCVGVLLCITGSNLAIEQGVAIFSQTGDSENNYITVKEFEAEELKKIIINVTDVHVNVYGNSDRNAVELINFTDGTYSCDMQSKSTMQIADTTGITSIIDLDNLKINFNGFRDYLHYFQYRDRVRQLNLYLTDDISVINLSVTTTGKGDVLLKDLSLNKSLDDDKCYCDYKVTVDSGNVTIDNIVTASAVKIISHNDSTVDVLNTECNELSVDAKKGYLTVKNTVFISFMDVEVEEGSATYYSGGRDFSNFDVLYKSGSGNLTKDGVHVENGIFEHKGASHVTEGDEDGPLTPSENEKTSKANTISVIVLNGEIKIY